MHMTAKTKQKLLQELYDASRTCNNCPYGKTADDHKVFGTGNLDAQLFFIGEAPGKQEDLEKQPFVGRSGKLLNQAMEKAGFSRKDIFITNIVKCRPPNNRTPLSQEITPAVKELLTKEIEIIAPRVICVLGATAAKALLNRSVAMSSLRGSVGNYQGILLVHTYHPAYILRNRAAEKDFVADLKKAYKLAEVVHKSQSELK